MNINRLCIAALFTSVAACAPSSPKAQDTSEPVATPVSTATVWPAELNVIGDGYPAPGDPCRRLGESAATVNLLDDSAILVGCPGAQDDPAVAAIVGKGGKLVGSVQGITMISVPQGQANAGMAPPAAVKP